MRKHQVLSWFVEAQTEKRGDKAFTLNFQNGFIDYCDNLAGNSANFLKEVLWMNRISPLNCLEISRF